MALLERLEIIIEADARTAEREFDRIGRQATESLESIETAAAKVGDNASAELAGASSKFRDAGRELSDAAARELDLSAAGREAAADVSRALESGRSDAEQAGRRVGDSAAAGVAEGVRSGGSQVRGAGGDLGAAAGESLGGGMLDSLSGIGGDLSGALDDALSALPPGLVGPAGAAAAVVGAAFVNGFADAIQSENLGDVIAARVGAGAAESEQFARVSAKVYRDAWGQSTAEVGDAVDAVYSTLADSRQSEEALADLTTRAQAFAEVFNQDVGQAVSNAGVLIETGLARDAVEAFDLMTAAAQRVPAAMRDELGEATQEYSTFFATLGFDGRESFAILTDAAEEGRYELDKTGDAIKELSIRATDLNDVAAMSALEDLGLNARNTATDLLAGGDAARIATQNILDALSAVEDPAEQAAAAVALMGAPLEDLNKSEIPEFVDRLADASDGMRDVEGASDRLTDSLANTQNSFESFRRNVLGGFEDAAETLLDPLDEDLFKNKGSSIGDAFGAAIEASIVSRFGAGDFFYRQIFGDGNGDQGETPQWLLDTIAEVQGLRDDAGGPPILDLDAIAQGAPGATDSIERLNAEVELSAALFDNAAERADNYLASISDSTTLDNAIDAQLQLRDAAVELADGLGALQGVNIKAFADGTEQVSDEAAAALGDISGAASAAQQQIANVLQWEGDAAAVEKAGELRDGFVEMFDAANLSDKQIMDLLGTMGLLPEQVDTAITVSGVEEALAVIEAFQTSADLLGAPQEIQVQVAQAQLEGRLTDAKNLIDIWVRDRQDGLLNDPLLIAMGLGDTGEATAAIGAWKLDEEGKPPVELPIDADTQAARSEAARLFNDIQRLNPTVRVNVAANLANLATAFPIFGNGFQPPRSGRATGGPVTQGVSYAVNEVGSEMFVPSTPGFVMDHSESRALIEGVRALVAGGASGGPLIGTLNQYGVADPMQTAEEIILAARAERHLVGAR